MTSKERMIHILLILQKETSNEQFLTTAEIVKRFTDMGIPTDRTTVKKDIDTMIACGIHILAERGTQMHYSYVDHTFELAEMKMLIDAVGASKFITAERSEALIKKLNSMTSQKNAEELKRQLFNAGRVKTENKSTLYVVDAVYRAINERRKIEFIYYEYNVEKERVPRRGGEKYQLSPYAMLYNEDKYYLLGYSERMDKVITLRVDRMSVPEMLPEPIHPEPEGFSPADYATNTFSMYEGEQGVVKLLCENQLMDSMIDRFGLAFETAVVDEEHFIAEVEVSVSRTFFAWVFQFAGGIKILGPEPILKEYHDMLNHAQ